MTSMPENGERQLTFAHAIREALSEETPKDPRQAEAGLLDLAALFRQWLVQGQASRTRLRAERELLDRYLAVEQRRMGPHLRCRAQWTGEAEDLELPSMTLLALVRGCLEEARASSVGVDLRLEVRGQDEGLNARLICNGRLRSAEPPPATLAALRARLEAWEGGGSLELVQEGSHFEALLRVGGAPHAMA